MSLVIGMLVLAVSLTVARALYLDDIPTEVLSPDAAAAVADTVTEPLRLALRAVAVLGLVIAVAAYLLGGSASAATVRHGFSHGLDALQHRRRARPANVFEETAYRARIALRAGVIGMAALLLMFWNYPTGLVVLLIALFALVALLAIEIVIRPARTGPEQDDATPMSAA